MWFRLEWSDLSSKGLNLNRSSEDEWLLICVIWFWHMIVQLNADYNLSALHEIYVDKSTNCVHQHVSNTVCVADLPSQNTQAQLSASCKWLSTQFSHGQKNWDSPSVKLKNEQLAAKILAHVYTNGFSTYATRNNCMGFWSNTQNKCRYSVPAPWHCLHQLPSWS